MNWGKNAQPRCEITSHFVAFQLANVQTERNTFTFTSTGNLESFSMRNISC